MKAYKPPRLEKQSYNPTDMTTIGVVNGQKRETSVSSSVTSQHGPGAIAQVAPTQNGNGVREQKRCEIYRYSSDKQLYASAWSYNTDMRFRLAVATCVDRNETNRISVVQLKEDSQEMVEVASFNHEFAVNAMSFIPDQSNVYPELIATTGDCLKIWRVNGNRVDLDIALNNTTQFSAPLTNFDWNDTDPRLIGTASLDTTCTIYDVEVGTAIASTPTTYGVKTQLIAHDKPVYDIGFSRVNNGKDHFATVGADGSARMFDLRRLEHSTIVYEDPNKSPLMRLAWNKQEPYYMATFAEDSNEVIVLDIRMPCSALCKLKNHNGAVNGIAWAPHSPHHICTAGDDAQALIWDLQHIPRQVEDPILAYSAGGEVNQVHWGPIHSNWICIFLNLSTADEFRFAPRAAPVATSQQAANQQPVNTTNMMDHQAAPMIGAINSHFTAYPQQTAPQQASDPFNNVSSKPPQQSAVPAVPASIDVAGTSSSSQGMSQQQQQQQSAEPFDSPMEAGTSDTNMPSAPASVRDDPRRKEIYAFTAPYTLYSHGWSAATDPSRKFRLAVSSFIEEYSNKISIVQLDEDIGELVLRSTFDHPYPATKIMWIPDQKGTYPDLLATSGDYLRLWRIGTDNNARIESLLNTNRTAEYCAPLTSFDWNELDLNLIGTSSIDTTCTVWQLETGQAIGSTRPAAVDGSVRTQLIAHDKEVFDISFSRGSSQIFASVGADGSLRLFDLRRLEHSTIMYEDANRSPLLKLAWNRNDHNYIATFAQDSKEVIILDLRLPCTPVARLRNHEATINGISWAPHSGSHICTAGDDYQALIWDVHEMPKPIDDPILAYQAGSEVNSIHWSNSFPDWISICSENKLEILRV